jgi:hypothetical protein
MSGRIFKITVCFESRPDGGLRAYSDDVPGLVLSSLDIDGVLEDVTEALKVILSERLKADVEVEPLPNIRQVLESDGIVAPPVPGPREYVAIRHWSNVIANRLLSREEWEAKLRRWHCRPLEGKGPLNTAEWWIGSKGGPFTVPIEGEDDRCEFWALQRICRDFGFPPQDLEEEDWQS